MNINPSTAKEIEYIDNTLGDFNKSQLRYTKKMDYLPLNFNIKNEQAQIIAGINAFSCWQMLYISEFFVEEIYRHQGLGTQLLTKVEEEAKYHGTLVSHTDTFDWQAKDFYLKHGYEVFGEIEDCPEGHKRYFLKKRLTPIDLAFQNHIQTTLTDLKTEVNKLLGFHEGTPRINYGPCGIFAKLFFDAWNKRFKNKVHIVFVMMTTQEECWHIAIRLPSGKLFDGGIGIHDEESYGDGYLIEDMFDYDEARLEKWSYGLDREFPRFCPKFNKEAIDSLIKHHLDCLSVKI